jgi:outer membrane protein assembly factor BamB
VVGHTSGAIEAGQHKGSSDVFLIKLNADGTEAWRRQFGTAAVDQAWSVAHASDGSVYVAGSTGGNLAGVNPPPASGTTSLFVAKYTESGAHVWTRQLGVNNKTTIARGVSVGADGQVYVAGYTSGALASSLSRNVTKRSGRTRHPVKAVRMASLELHPLHPGAQAMIMTLPCSVGDVIWLATVIGEGST